MMTHREIRDELKEQRRQLAKSMENDTIQSVIWHVHAIHWLTLVLDEEGGE